jgi:DNA-binding NarL/FixJ family response regulator
MVATTDQVALFERALAVPEADRSPFELARVQLAYGECLHRQRLDSQARQEFQSAADASDLLRANPWAGRARSGMAASSGRRGPRAGSASTLTARELEVATLAASGLSNITIAARLGTSPRTVSAHVSHILAKLSLRSRAGLRCALAGVDDEQVAGVPGS